MVKLLGLTLAQVAGSVKEDDVPEWNSPPFATINGCTYYSSFRLADEVYKVGSVIRVRPGYDPAVKQGVCIIQN